MRAGLQVGEVMTRRPICVPENITVREASRIMTANTIGSLIVTQGDDLRGIITVEDILGRVVALAKNADDVTVGDIMTTEVITTQPDKDVVNAMDLMKDHDIRHLPVLDKEKLIGFLTMKDIIKVEPQLFELMLDSIELREEDRKLAQRTTDTLNEGFCEVCGNFSEELERGPDQRLTCPDCQEDEEDL